MDLPSYYNLVMRSRTGRYRLMGDIIRILRILGPLELRRLVNTINRVRMNRGEEPVLLEEIHQCINNLLHHGLIAVHGDYHLDWSGRLIINGAVTLPDYVMSLKLFINDNLMDEITLYL